MRFAFCALVLAGCMQQDPQPYPGPGPIDTGGCTDDSQCGGLSCARDGQCVSSSQLYTAHITWTVKTATADATSCANSPSLDLDFSGGGGGFGFAPVPCMEGKFSIDRLETWFTGVHLYPDGDPGNGAYGTITAGNVALDLP